MLRQVSLWWWVAILCGVMLAYGLACGDDDDDDDNDDDQTVDDDTADDDAADDDAADDDAADDDAADDDAADDDDTVPPYTGDDDFASQCRAYYRDCWGASPAQQNSLCGWLDGQQDDFNDCLKWAMAHWFQCLDTNVTCGDGTAENQARFNACQKAYIAERDACF
ncbi:MAG: hypothetical protein GX444_16080 [Myxococcales bacterium]|nr:hypothetical protein [Myxococcales bacterium]